MLRRRLLDRPRRGRPVCAAYVERSVDPGVGRFEDEMVENKTEVLHVDATIELKDYFHAYCDTAKTSLIVACLIVATVVVAFSYFFILIGEQTLLWQLSPLFFGLPIVAIVGQFLRIHASYRKISQRAFRIRKEHTLHLSSGA